MGCVQSKEAPTPKLANEEPSSPADVDEKSSPMTALSPSVALQNLLNRHNLVDMSTTAGKSLQSVILVGGRHVRNTLKLGEKGLRDATHQVPRHLRNVFAKPIELIAGASSKIPYSSKSPEEKEFLEAALRKNFVFENLAQKQILPMVDALEQHLVAAGSTIIEQGEEGDYFYILYEGECAFILDDNKVGSAHAGDSFGELALLYDAPRAATVNATTDCILYRVDQVAFRLVLREQAQAKESSKLELLRKVAFLKDVDTMELEKLANVMTPRTFTAGQTLATKGDDVRAFWLLESGRVKFSNIGEKGIKYEDILMKAGDYWGEYAIASGRSTAADIVAEEDGLAFVIDREMFEKVLGKLDGIILRSMDRKKLSAIKIIKDTELDATTIATIASYVTDRKWRAGQRIMVEGKSMEAGMYLIRKGKIRIYNKSKARDETMGEGGYFGEEQLMSDVKRKTNGPNDPTTCRSLFTVEVLEDCVCGILWLAVLRNCLDTTMLGQPQSSLLDSLITRQMPMKELTKHTILGSGTFGQVWLVSRIKSSGDPQAYALKVQSKYELVESGQARAVVEEKNIMAALHSPFLISLVTTYKDENCVYMLMELVQGGELYSVMENGDGGMKEDKARFYIAGIAEGLLYMHRRGVVYRDLKPENVLVKGDGYPVIIDFGFAKRVRNKTFTLCGTPLYLAPEVILNRGHNWAADHFSLGVLTYEMLCGYTPFYKSGMDQSQLFKAILKGSFHMPKKLSHAASEIISGLLVKDPSMRLGSLAGGEADIVGSAFLRAIDMDKLRKHQIKPPQVPVIKDPLDASNFDDWSHLEDKMNAHFPSLTPDKEAIFDRF